MIPEAVFDFCPKPKVHIITFGCQMNEHDSERMARLLLSHGYDLTDQRQEAAVILINTCSVRQKAESKVYAYLGSLKPLKKARPELILGVGGCVAQQEGRKLLDLNPHLNLVFGPSSWGALPDLLKQAALGQRPVCLDAEILPGLEPAEQPAAKLKALVTVMRGCDNFCSYCVVPYVRGREQSRPVPEIEEEAYRLVEEGAREITLLGQNVNSYHDKENKADFSALLKRMALIPGLKRIRFNTNHPKDLTRELMELMAYEPKIMEQIHLPAQAGSNRVLKAMNRGYTREQYLALVQELREVVPLVSLGGDIIVGFPGETQEDFTDTMDLINQVSYNFLFSFKYSYRPFTEAGKRTDQLDEKIKKERLAILQSRQRSIILRQHEALVGCSMEVMVEGPAKRGENLLSGRSRSGHIVNFSWAGHDKPLPGSIALVSITNGYVNSLKGRYERVLGEE